MDALSLYAFIISLVSTALIIFFSARYNLFIDDSASDKPQNFHTTSTPRAGGMGILVGLSLFVFTTFGLQLTLPILFAFASGIFEDFHNSLSPKLRLFLQFIAAVVAIWMTNSVVTYLGLGITMPYWMGALFSIFAIVGMMNAINMIDGFNGLASGVVLLILGSFALISYQHHDLALLQIITITMASILGFFLLNFPKGKIFLGDGGAYLLGFIVAVIGIFLAGRYEDISPWYILSLFIYPVWEVLFSIMRKLSIGLSPMQPDSQHMHMLIHRQITKNNPLTALFILILLLPSTAVSTLYAYSSLVNIFIVIIVVIGYLILYRFLVKKES